MPIDWNAPNWDNYGAVPVSDTAYAEALRFMAPLPRGLPAPEITPEPDGDVALDWHIAKGWALSLSFSGRGVITYAGLFGLDDKAHGTEPLHDTIPAMTYRLIRKIAGYSG